MLPEGKAVMSNVWITASLASYSVTLPDPATTLSLNVKTMLLSTATVVALSEGADDDKVGVVVSILIAVTRAASVPALPAESRKPAPVTLMVPSAVLDGVGVNVAV